MDPYKFLRLRPNADGSLTRFSSIPNSPPTTEDHPSAAVLSKDIPLNAARNTWLRLYSPRIPHRHLPVILYFHGGGFILFSAATSIFHSCCNRIASDTPALVASLEYRLAPEHPLPAAYDDAIDALLWLKDQALSISGSDPWLSHADFSRCFLIGNSSGGNIAYHAGVRALALDLLPVRVAGLILDQPYFGGEERTESETRFADDMIIPLPANDLMWRLALPGGADRDHEYCNPMRHPRAHEPPLPRCLVRGYAGDPLIDRQRELVRMLAGRAEDVVERTEGEGFHGVEFFDETKADAFMEDIRAFVAVSSPNPTSAL